MSNCQGKMTVDKMFNCDISVYQSFDKSPHTVLLDSWIYWNIHGCRLTDKIIEYRKTGDRGIKLSLPFATVSGVFQEGRRLENMISKSGWIALDIDGKDNPDKRPESIRDALGKLTEVAFSGLSTGGKGVWILVKLSDPDNLIDHFNSLKRDFNHLKIILDESKGRNLNDARFLSYDPDAIVKDSAHIYVKKMRPSSRKIPLVSKADSALLELKRAKEGERNNKLFKASMSLLNSHYSRFEVEQVLRQTALEIGLSLREIDRTINNAKRYLS